MTDAKVNIERELELIDGMIEVQLHHAKQCDGIANRTMAEKQKAWDMERVALLRKMRAALAAQPAEPVARVVPYGATAKLIWEDTAAARDCRPGPLYAAQPAPAEVPLTEEVLNIHKPYYSDIEWPCFKAGVRFAEMVHGTAATTCHVPPGWKLVPIEPTEAMIASGAVALVKASHSDIDPTMEEVTAAYRAMIAAGDKP